MALLGRAACLWRLPAARPETYCWESAPSTCTSGGLAGRQTFPKGISCRQPWSWSNPRATRSFSPCKPVRGRSWRGSSRHSALRRAPGSTCGSTRGGSTPSISAQNGRSDETSELVPRARVGWGAAARGGAGGPDPRPRIHALRRAQSSPGGGARKLPTYVGGPDLPPGAPKLNDLRGHRGPAPSGDGPRRGTSACSGPARRGGRPHRRCPSIVRSRRGLCPAVALGVQPAVRAALGGASGSRAPGHRMAPRPLGSPDVDRDHEPIPGRRGVHRGGGGQERDPGRSLRDRGTGGCLTLADLPASHPSAPGANIGAPGRPRRGVQPSIHVRAGPGSLRWRTVLCHDVPSPVRVPERLRVPAFRLRGSDDGGDVRGHRRDGRHTAPGPSSLAGGPGPGLTSHNGLVSILSATLRPEEASGSAPSPLSNRRAWPLRKLDLDVPNRLRGGRENETRQTCFSPHVVDHV